jgi:hypothetical protein
LKTFLTGAALLPLVIACGVVRPEKKAVTTTAQPVKAAGATFAVGTSVTRDGAVTAESTGDTFHRGPEMYLAIDVASASVDQKIEVDWIDPAGRIVRSEARNVREGTHYATFSTGNTRMWRPGPYRAVISINDRKVNETTFALL